MRRKTILTVGLTVLPLWISSAAAAGETEILAPRSYWRWHVTMRPPLVEDGGKTEPLKRAYVNYRHYGDQLENPPPPAGWEKTDFDDSEWPRGRGDWMRGVVNSRWSTFAICARGKFAVTNAASCRLKLSIAYRGGVRVLVNGQEVARENLPEGDLAPDAVAKAYPAEAFVDGGGKPIVGARERKRLPAAKKKELEDRIAKRERRLEMQVPAKVLRRGINVLAVEVRRANFHPSAAKWFTGAWIKKGAAWKTIDIASVALTASGGGATPNVSRPAGVRLWNHDVNDRVCVLEYGDPNEKVAPVRMAGARNGSFLGEVVLGADAALTGVRVTPGALKGEKGEIPADRVTALFGRRDMAPYGKQPWFLGLAREAPAQVGADPVGKSAILPVVIRVRVPEEEAAGVYRGELTVSASGKSFKVPLEVSVADWTLPEPRDFRTYVGIYQSPTTVSLVYKVDLWSDEHWKFVDKSFEMLGRVGNKMVNIPVVDETQFGNPEGMVWFVKKKDGSWDYDFTHFDKYMSIVLKHCGPQDYVPLQIWHAGGWSHRKPDVKCTVQVVDEATGKRAPMQVPLWGTPEATAFWKPFFAQMQAKLTELKMPKAMLVGILSDSTAPPEVFKTMKEAWPGGTARWHRGCHVHTNSAKPYAIGRVGGSEVALHEHCYGMSMVKPDVKPLPKLHEFRGKPGTAYFRVSGHMVTSTQLSTRTMVERGLWCQKQGIGRICFDFWNYGKKRRGSNFNDIYNRYPHSSCAQRRPSLAYLSWPGKEGAETNKRFELFVLGLQSS
ncbi:MAG: glycoside hydrolase domain-containing protein, partial [Planctomycetota bacterium]